MNAVEQFANYAMAFEQAYVDDDWGRVADLLSDDAVYETFGAPPLAGRAVGRAAAVERLRASVDALDRRFDVRLPEILAGPEERDGGVWMRFALTLQRAGLPPLRITGEHTVYVENGRIRRIEEYVPVAVSAAVAAYLARCADRLEPARHGAAHAIGDAAMRQLVADYAAAKSRQDAEAALALCSEDFQLETVALGVRADGAAQARAQLAIFFMVFPDYRVAALDGMAVGDGVVTAWGRVRMTFAGPLGELPPTRRTAELPFFSVFPVRGDRLAGERFFFDAATLCDQTGIPLETLRAATAAL